MEIIPAIDLYQEKVVRLVKGSKLNCKIYSSNPLSVAEKWVEQGAKRLHLVDLSAAFSQGNNLKIVIQIIKKLQIPVQVGGGIRSLTVAQELLAAGADRLILATAASDKSFLKNVLRLAGKTKIVAAVDEKDGKAAVAGWEKTSAKSIQDYLDYLKQQGVYQVIYTDVSGDGTLRGLDFSKISRLTAYRGLDFIFSGGVASLSDIEKLKKKAPSARGLIVGKALYEAKFSLAQAILTAQLPIYTSEV